MGYLSILILLKYYFDINFIENDNFVCSQSYTKCAYNILKTSSGFEKRRYVLI